MDGRTLLHVDSTPHARSADDVGVTVLDGGLATTLEARGHDLAGPLWSARLLVDAPGEIAAVHRAFVEAGAEVVTTATYQLWADGLAALGRSPGEMAALTDTAVRVARAATDGRPGVRVAGSVGPYGATLPGAREYVGRYGLGVAELVAFHRPRVTALLDAGVDVLLVETVPSADELQAIVEVVAEAPVPVWVSVTTDERGTTTPEGTPLAEALAPLTTVPTVAAIGVNCVPPHRVAPALHALAGLGVPLLASPNAGATYDGASGTWLGETTVADPRPWTAAGARIVGGCCGTSPDDLATLARRLHRTS